MRENRVRSLAEVGVSWRSEPVFEFDPGRRNTRSCWIGRFLPTFGPIRDITMESVDRWYAKTATHAPTLRAHAYSLLRTILETARTRDRLIDVSHC